MTEITDPKTLTDANRCPECGKPLVYETGAIVGMVIFCENEFCGLYLGKVEASK